MQEKTIQLRSGQALLLRQVVTAVADGANAVASVQEYLYKMI